MVHFLSFILELEKILEALNFHIMEEKKEVAEQKQFLRSGKKISTSTNSLKATKVKVTFIITFVFFCSDSILLHYWVSYSVFSWSFMFGLISVSWLEDEYLFNNVLFSMSIFMSKGIWTTLIKWNFLWKNI